MCEHTNGDSGILTSIGWVDLETNEAQIATAKGAKTDQSTASNFQIWAEKPEL